MGSGGHETGVPGSSSTGGWKLKGAPQKLTELYDACL